MEPRRAPAVGIAKELTAQRIGYRKGRAVPGKIYWAMARLCAVSSHRTFSIVAASGKSSATMPVLAGCGKAGLLI